jgi:hypothetical protein
MAGILTRKGVNAQRRLASGRTNYDDEINDLVTSQPAPFFLRAVVVDVIHEPYRMRSKILEKYSDSVVDPTFLETAPRNSIIARVISGGVDRRNPTASIFYPAMSHSLLPIKPGEQVWVFYEHPESVTEQGFWLSRIVEAVDIDDPNFTHGDRKFADERQASTIDRLKEAKLLETLSPEAQKRLSEASGNGPQFPNGGDTPESLSLGDFDGYEKIEKESLANSVVTKEPVPRYNKRPAEWVAEGSNNSLIVLGEEPDRDAPAGIFDFVVGRGSVDKTAAKPVTNSRNLKETEKSIGKANPDEGDFDYESDKTRIRGSMDMDVDGIFGKELPDLNGGQAVEQISKGPALVCKSDHIRVIARKDGSIRIVKEGVADSESGDGRAVIIIEKDGTIMIDGPTIILGSGIQKGNGSGKQVFVGRDAEEPLVLGNILKGLLETYTKSVQDAISAFAQTLQALNSPPGIMGNFGLPLPGMPIIAGATTALDAAVKAATQSLTSQLSTILSQVGKTL